MKEIKSQDHLDAMARQGTPAKAAMTKAEALAIVCDIASRWGENAEEAFPKRIESNMTDEQIRDMLKASSDYCDEDEVTAFTVRDLWRAIEVLKAQVNN